jgi:predicted permease
MDRFRQDLVVAIRRLRSSPGFAIAAIVTLALGIGANTAIFSAVNALVFRSLAVERPNELYSLNQRTAKDEFPTLSIPNYNDVRDRNQVLSGLAMYRPQPVNFSRGDGNNVRMWGYEVSGNYFGVLGVHAERGRLIEPDDDRVRGGHPVAVITWACWQRRFAGDPEIAGKRIRLNGMSYDVIGVAPREFVGTEMVYTPEIFVPVAMIPQIEGGAGWMDRRNSNNMFVIGRAKPGVNEAQALAGLNAVWTDLAREYPKENAGVRLTLSPPGLFGSLLRGAVRGFAAVIMGVSGLVLLIACVNLASLLLARASDRRRETAIRLALGAGRGHLTRQLLTESLLLSAIGGTAGVVLAVWLIDLFAAWKPPIDVPVIPAIAIDWRVLAFAAVASIVTGVLFGLAPALASTRVALAPALKNEAVAERLRRFHPRDVLVAAQIALSVVLLVGSVLVVRSLQHALTLNLGFEPRGAAAVSVDLSLEGYSKTRALDFHRRLLARVRSLPGIESAGLAASIPLTLNWSSDSIYFEGKPEPQASEVPQAADFNIDDGYLKVMRTRLIAGRDFDERDRPDSPLVALVNHAFAAELLPGEDPVGKRFHAGSNAGKWYQIVGVVEDGKYRSLGEKPAPAVFFCGPQEWGAGDVTILARSSMPDDQIAALLRRAVLELDPSLTLYSTGSLTDQLGLVLLPAKIAAVVLGSFGLLAIVLAATGVYGVMAYAVSRRTREIGIRMALGARPGSVLGVVLRRTVVLVAAGTVAGAALALVAGGAFSQILYGISSRDPLAYSLAVILMAAIAGLACWVPAMRAIRVDPVKALRTE